MTMQVSPVTEPIGPEVTLFKPGDEVFGEVSRCGFGAYAEYVVARENALARKPENLSFEEAAAIPTAGCTRSTRNASRIWLLTRSSTCRTCWATRCRC